MSKIEREKEEAAAVTSIKSLVIYPIYKTHNWWTNEWVKKILLIMELAIGSYWQFTLQLDSLLCCVCIVGRALCDIIVGWFKLCWVTTFEEIWILKYLKNPQKFTQFTMNILSNIALIYSISHLATPLLHHITHDIIQFIKTRAITIIVNGFFFSESD